MTTFFFFSLHFFKSSASTSSLVLFEGKGIATYAKREWKSQVLFLQQPQLQMLQLHFTFGLTEGGQCPSSISATLKVLAQMLVL